MDNRVGIISEVVVLIFNLLIYMKLTVPKNDNLFSRLLMYIVSAGSLGSFFVFTYTGIMAEVYASFVCVTLPTFILFFILSKYKDFRFFVTFCFLDTVTFIITFFSRAVDMLFGKTLGIICAVAVCVLMLIVYVKGKAYFGRYREIMSNINDGWGAMALSTFLIYMLLVFAAAYPKPLIERTEYVVVYALLSVTILSFYVVFIFTLLQKKKLYDLNAQLIKEKKWHEVAYIDALTGMENRMAYIERVNELERTAKNTDIIHAVMIDIDNFKNINDTLGHHAGDSALKSAAKRLNNVFAEDCYSTFRIGGDEFAIIAVNVSEQTLEQKVALLKAHALDSDIACSFSIGYSTVDFTQMNAMENAFICADRAMYEEKLKTKGIKRAIQEM